MNPQDSFNIPGLQARRMQNADAQKQQKIAENKAVSDAVSKTLQSQPVLDSEQEELVNMSKGAAATAGVSTNTGSNAGGSVQTSQTQSSVQSQVQAATTGQGANTQQGTQAQAQTQVKAEEFVYSADAQAKIQELEKAIKASNVPQTVLLVMSLALDLKTSDIHIEPEEDNIRIRYRIDGMLRQITEYKSNMHPAVVSRVKIMSDLKIDETRIPQDGRTSVQTTDGREMDLRVSTLPTVNGEKVVMRLQDKSKDIPTLEALGILGNAQKAIKTSLTKPNGVILTSGPTGSGKTTTLYASLNILNQEGVNILTIEDPVEIQLDGLNQAQVKADIGFDFAKGLRAALRQDPDIIMVGEIRDHETIDVAIEAALTGHLVFSTIHTNSAVETITRIANMGVPQYLIASAVDTIIAQRLVRRVNPEKCEKYQLEGKALADVRAAIAQIPDSEKANYPELDFDNPTFLKPLPQYALTAYQGRVGVYEVLTMTGQIKDAILKGANVLELQNVAQAEGMVTLEQYGLILAMKGFTTLDEVYRVSNTD
jgi:type IV pilus assembly protein PilB